MRAILAVTAALLVLALPAPAQEPDPDGTGITIAVVDSGVDSTHPELSGRVTRQSFAEPSVPGLPLPGVDTPVAEDPDGQGTAVASMAAGRSLGVAPGARILDLQVSAKYTPQEAGLNPQTEAAAIEAMDALLRDPARARVVVLSFAENGVSDEGGRTLAAQANSLRDDGVLVIVPTGPASNPLAADASVLTVAGDACPAALGSTLKPDLVAPSTGRTVATPATSTAAGGTGTMSGTALAAAQVAGAAALLFDLDENLPVDAVAAFLRDAATDQDETGPDTCSGFGELNTTSALAWARMWNDPLASSGTRDSPAPGLALLLVGLAVAAVASRRWKR